jgi:hypothetical protein
MKVLIESSFRMCTQLLCSQEAALAALAAIQPMCSDTKGKVKTAKDKHGNTTPKTPAQTAQEQWSQW